MLRVNRLLRPAILAALLAAGALGGAGTGLAAGQPAAPQAPSAHPPGAVQALPAPGCLKPGVPLCMDDGTTFVSADKMSGCQFEVKDYVDKTMAYLKCLNDENVATGHDLTRNVERFNCRLSGRKGCN